MAGNLFIKRPKFAIVISIAIILAGLISLTTLPLEEYPSITPPQVIVSATYSGASSDVITSTIAAPIELQLNGIEDMLYMSSESKNGSYKLTLCWSRSRYGSGKCSKPAAIGSTPSARGSKALRFDC